MSIIYCACKLLIGFNKNIYNKIKKIQAVYMAFLNYNKIFDIDILNLETGCNKIRDDFDHEG